MKTIKLKKNELLNAINIDKEKENTQYIIECIYNEFMNEYNKNEYESALTKLNEYRHLKKGVCCPCGRYAMYIDKKDFNKMKLYSGGFVVGDTGYSITLKVNTGDVYKISRKDKEFFVRFTDNERMRYALSKLEND